ncbi:hypothetical protein Gotri_007891 [Gossypium trilobum]|uniref:RNase H type-1 domain-containing protein n=1 Tax=Gossypium trilobum TaxID=34281 RepID=A0A7J9EIC7_9ROSI|nr:hypothetical protein [Gossypium trilobum]
MVNTWVNLFIDSAVASGDGSTSVRGILRDQHGNWILGILDGLLVLLSKGFKKATTQTDNLKVVRALQDNLMIDSSIIMLRRVRRIIRTEGQWCIRYVPREFNEIADCSTKLSLVEKIKSLDLRWRPE